MVVLIGDLVDAHGQRYKEVSWSTTRNEASGTAS